VLAGPARLDGLGALSVAVLDARTGSERATFDQPRNGQLTIVHAAWESDDTVVALAIEGPRNALLRLGVDGTLELATEVVNQSGFEDVAFYLSEDRRRQ
jgi:hypothetical protein